MNQLLTMLLLSFFLVSPENLLLADEANQQGTEKEKPSGKLLWILSGQSNACGRAKLPGPTPNELVTMYDPASKQFIVAQDPLPGMGTTGVGPWVAAAQEVVTHKNIVVKMCGYASGGKPISYWNPGQPGHRGLFPVIEKAGQNAEFFLWYQGENNAGGDLTTGQYLQGLKDHVARVRKASGNPKLIAVIVQLGPSLSKSRGGYMAIREAQRQFVLQDASAILVPAIGRTLKDSVHLDNAGYRELGREIGRAVLKLKYNQNKNQWPGPVLDSARLQPRSKARVLNHVVAHFAEVEQLQGALNTDFAMIDAEGTNRCTELTAGKTTVSLQFERDVILPARLIYGFGTAPKATLQDESGNRAPAVQIPVHAGKPPEDNFSESSNGAGF